jgi:hypothetical protein
MKAEYWRTYIKDVVANNDLDKLNLIARLLEENEKAKEALRDKGYGATGLNLVKIIQEEVPMT